MTTNENISSSNPTNQANEPSEALLTAIGLRFCSSLTFKAISKDLENNSVVEFSDKDEKKKTK